MEVLIMPYLHLLHTEQISRQNFAENTLWRKLTEKLIFNRAFVMFS